MSNPANTSTTTVPKPKGAFLLTWLILAGLVIGMVVGEVMYQSNRSDLETVEQLNGVAYESWKALPQAERGPFSGRFDLLTAEQREQRDKANTALGPLRSALDVLKFVGDTFFIGLLKMILIPLVASSVIVGVASIDPAHLGRIGGLTVLYYVATMVVAVTIGLAVVTTFQPGNGFPETFREQATEQFQAEGGVLKERAEKAGETGRKGLFGALWDSFKQITTQLIPSNPIGAAAEGQILPVIAFSLIFGVALTVLGPPGRVVLEFANGIFQAVMLLVSWVLWLAPVGVLCLVAWTVARIGSVALLGPLGAYMAVVLLGLAFHAFVVLPMVLFVFGKANPFRYMWQMKTALMTAFGTDSSSATLPVTIEYAETEGGVSKKAAGFVLPLGATINMDGTALYEAVAVVFLFQAFGIDLTAVQMVIIVITATLAAIGAAGIPSAGLVTMVIVVEAVNKSLGGSVPNLPLAAVGIILGVDRILDMCRTTVNVWGDAVGAKIITRIAPDEPSTQPVPA